MTSFSSINKNTYCDTKSKQVTLWGKKIELFHNPKEFTVYLARQKLLWKVID